jgi:hypothetical protein
MEDTRMEREFTGSQVFASGVPAAPGIWRHIRGQEASWLVHQVFLVLMGTEVGSMDWDATRERRLVMREKVVNECMIRFLCIARLRLFVNGMSVNMWLDDFFHKGPRHSYLYLQELSVKVGQ